MISGIKRFVHLLRSFGVFFADCLRVFFPPLLSPLFAPLPDNLSAGVGVDNIGDAITALTMAAFDPRPALTADLALEAVMLAVLFFRLAGVDVSSPTSSSSTTSCATALLLLSTLADFDCFAELFLAVDLLGLAAVVFL